MAFSAASHQSSSMSRFQLLHILRDLREERRAIGWKGLLKRRGWKLVLVAVVFYVVRDVILYVLIPLAVVVGITK